MVVVLRPDTGDAGGGGGCCSCILYTDVLCVSASIASELGLKDPLKRIEYPCPVYAFPVAKMRPTKSHCDFTDVGRLTGKRVYGLGPRLFLMHEDDCACLCHLSDTRFRLAEYLWKGFTSTVIACERVFAIKNEVESPRMSPHLHQQPSMPLLNIASKWFFTVSDSKEIVIKILHKCKCDNQELARCIQESKFLSQLRHKNIVKLLASFDGINELWMLFERSHYLDLGECTKSKALPEDQVKHIILEILEALEYCHSKRVIHGDVKPQNILVYKTTMTDCQVPKDDDIASTRPLRHEPNPRIYLGDWRYVRIRLADFGLAMLLPLHRDAVKFESVQGSHGYFAPEILLRRDYNCKVDMWALGIITFQLLGGYEPFYPASACISEDVRFDERDWKNISNDGKDFVAALLKFDPSERMSAKEALDHRWMIETRRERVLGEGYCSLARTLSRLRGQRCCVSGSKLPEEDTCSVTYDDEEEVDDEEEEDEDLILSDPRAEEKLLGETSLMGSDEWDFFEAVDTFPHHCHLSPTSPRQLMRHLDQDTIQDIDNQAITNTTTINLTTESRRRQQQQPPLHYILNPAGLWSNEIRS